MVVALTFTAAVIQQIFGLRHLSTMHPYQSCGNIFGRHRFQQPGAQRAIFVLNLYRSQKRFEQTFMVLGPNVRSGRNLDPIRLNLCTAQHGFHALAALIGHYQYSSTLAACTTCTARSMLKPFGIARQFDMHNQR